MEIAQRRTNSPLVINNVEIGNLLIEALANKQYSLMRLRDKLGYLIRNVTLFWVDVFDENGSKKRFVAASVQNPKDNLDRWAGRMSAMERLESYLLYGEVKKHSDGRSAEHFVMELNEEDLQTKWKLRVAQEIVANANFPLNYIDSI